jgi:hypothetical protein
MGMAYPQQKVLHPPACFAPRPQTTGRALAEAPFSILARLGNRVADTSAGPRCVHEVKEAAKEKKIMNNE